MKKKFLSVLLCLCMVCMLLPTTALAVGHTVANHPICGANCTDKSHSNQDWIGLGATLPEKAGNYYLTTDVTLCDHPWTPADGTVLCLNGHSITTEGIDDYAILVKYGGTFTLSDCGGTGTITCGAGTNGCRVYEGSTFNMYGGSITGNTATYNGGGVRVEGTFNMYDGSITGNTTKYGGGVYVYDGTFNMSGGSITGNTATSGDKGDGGGVYVYNGTFNMSGGSITNNTATSKGGGVYVAGAGGTFTMSGGSITNNTATSKGGGGGVYVSDGTFEMFGTASITGNTANSAAGGGVYVYDGTFNMYGGSITGNTTKHGGGVYVSVGTFNMSGGTIGGTAAGAANTAKDGNGGGVCVSGGTFKMSGTASITGNTGTFHGGGVYVAGGAFEMSGTASITGNNTATSNQPEYGGGGVYVYNGTFEMSETASITGNTAIGNGGGVYITQNKNGTAKFTMSGGTIGGTATGAANTAKDGAGGGVYVSGGTFEMSGDASITGNTADSYGGGVCVKGTFEMSGDASITGNTAKSSGGGGVCVSSGEFTMSGGKISDNQMIASSGALGTGGGGVCVYNGTFTMSETASITGNKSSERPGGGVYVGGGAFNMQGGTISGNTATGSDGYGNGGGGVYVEGGAFNMQGGSITGNTAAENGGGVYVGSNGSAAMTVSGGVNITGNKKGDDANNVYLSNYNNTVKTITVAGALEGASIGVTTSTVPITIAQGKTDEPPYSIKPNEANCFFPDAGSNYLVVYNEGDQSLYLKKHQHSWTYNPNSTNDTITANCAGCSTTETLTISASNTTYDGTAKPATLSDRSGFASKLKNVQVNYQKKTGDSTYDTATTTAPTNAGTYKASITVGTGESAVTASVEYTISQKVVSSPTIEVASGSTYDGTAKEPAVTVKDDGTTIDPGEYTVTYANNTKAGTDTATVTVKDNDGGNYTVNGSTTFTIAKKDLANDDVTVAAIPDQTYTGSAIQPEPVVTYNDMTLVKGTDYTLSYGDNTNVGDNSGSVTITAVADSNYTGTKTVNFNIVAKPGQVTISGDLDVTYGTEVPNVTINQYDSNGTTTVYYYTNAACTTGETTTKPTTAGDYWVKVKMDAAGNYGAAESNVIRFTISRADIIPVVSITGWTYKDSANAPSVSGNTGNGSVTYEYKGANDNTYTTTVPTAAGNYTVKATVAQTTNYNGGSATADFKINPKDISGVTIADIAAQTYNNGTAITPTPAVQDGDTTLTVGTDFTYGYENNINAGDSAVVKVNGQGNYTGTASKTFTISRADLTITVNITGWVVGGTSNAPSVTGNTGNGTVTYQYKVAEADDNTYTDAVPTAVGNYTVKATVAQTVNYNAATATTNFSISTKAVQTITAENVTVTYGDSDQAVSGTTSGDGTISYAVKYGTEFVEVNGSTGALTIKKVGTATITVTASETDSHAVASKDITVTVAPLAVTAPTADTTVFTYNGQDQAYGVTETANYTVSNGIQKNAGNYTVTVALKDQVNTVWADSNNTTDKTFGFEIKKATITIAAKNKSAYVNDTAPALGEGDYTVSGLATGENLKTLPTIAYASTPDMTKAGTVSITVSGAEAPDGGNYNDIIYNNGTFTISTRPSSGGGSYTPPTYKVESEVTADTDGSVSFSKGSASKNDTVTITVTPDRYYKVDGVTVKDKNGNEIAVTDNGDGTFTFKMPASKVTVEPVFSWDNPFTDVAEDTYYAPAVEWALKNDITNGTGDGTTFSPNAGCTRAQIVTFLWKAAGCPEPAGANSFTDVSADAYYAKAVAWAAEQGITGGTGDGKFSPDATCTRSQSMTFLYHAAGSPEIADGITFSDVADGSYYADAVVWAAQNGVTSGTSATTFSPNAVCTRAQIMTFLYRWMVK